MPCAVCQGASKGALRYAAFWILLRLAALILASREQTFA
jgi:hypothetical protein